MREIKFRAWDLEKEAWFILHSGLDTIAHDTRTAGGLSSLELGRDDLVIQQFTGLLDSNGVEIYEGDLVQLPPNDEEPRPIFEVRWNIEKCRFEMFKSDQSTYDIDQAYKVIGNIYETLSLITNSK